MVLDHAHAAKNASAYTLLVSETQYRQACVTLLARAKREILIFDRDLRAINLEETARLGVLADFLQADGLRRIRVVLRDLGPIEQKAPRLMKLISRYSNVFLLRQTPDNLRQLADAHILVDEGDGLRRFHVDQPRSALILDDPEYVFPWRQRFEQLWELSQPLQLAGTTGL